jgi:cysteine synthase A
MSGTAADRSWLARAVREIESDFARSADTHLIRLDLPQLAPVRLYLKDESIHPSGSLKHRLARSLFLYGLCNGWIREGRPVIEASSGSTAISEAYFARLIGVPFIAVVPENTAARKLDAIAFYGGQVRKTACPSELDTVARALAAETGGCFLDQFVNAERATDWRGNNNIAESLFSQFAREPRPAPDWVVVGAGTGGTSATLGRYIRYRPDLCGVSRLCVVDPEGSAFFRGFAEDRRDCGGRASTVVEGIGRPRVEASFLPSVIDRMLCVSDAASVAAVLWLERLLGRRCGPSTGTNLIGALALAQELKDAGREGAVATLICDPGDRYAETVYSEAWLSGQGVDPTPWLAKLEAFEAGAPFRPDLPSACR